MFLPFLLPLPVPQYVSGTGCRMVCPFFWTAKSSFRKAGIWNHFCCSRSKTTFDLIEFHRSLEGIWRPIDFAWAAVSQAPIRFAKCWNPRWNRAFWIWYACSTLRNNMPLCLNWHEKKLLKGSCGPLANLVPCVCGMFVWDGRERGMFCGVCVGADTLWLFEIWNRICLNCLIVVDFSLLPKFLKALLMVWLTKSWTMDWWRFRALIWFCRSKMELL